MRIKLSSRVEEGILQMKVFAYHESFVRNGGVFALMEVNHEDEVCHGHDINRFSDIIMRHTHLDSITYPKEHPFSVKSTSTTLLCGSALP